MSATTAVQWVESQSWEVPFFGLPTRIPWPAEADPALAHQMPLPVEMILAAIERLGTEAGQPWTNFLEASDSFADLGESLEQNDTEAALSALENIERLLPETAFALFHRALLARREGCDEDAIEFYRSATERAPGVPVVWSNLGVVLTMRGEKKEAEQAFRKALEIFPQDPLALEGLASLNKLVKLRSTDPKTPNQVHYMEPGSFREMVQQQVEQMTNPEQLFTYAEHLLREGTAPEAAVRAMERASELQPGQPRWTQALSAAYQQNGQHEKAREVLQRYTQLYPQDINGWVLLANAAHATQEPALRSEALEKALALDVNCQPALGMKFEIAPNEHDPAKQDALARYGAQNSSWMAYLLAGLIAGERGDHRAMLREVEQAYAINPDHEEVLLHYAEVLGNVKELPKLASIIRPAVESGKHTPRLAWHYAHVLQRLGMAQDAVGLLQGMVRGNEVPPEFRQMVETTMDAWQSRLTGGGVPAEVMQAGFLQRPILISLPDGDDGGILLAAGARLPAEASFVWRANGEKALVALQQGESESAREPLPLGCFKIRGIQATAEQPQSFNCQIAALPDGSLRFRAHQDERKLEVMWSMHP